MHEKLALRFNPIRTSTKRSILKISQWKRTIVENNKITILICTRP